MINPTAFFAGIGSRKTPQDVLDMMSTVGHALAKENWVLRSGGAEGADKAFERGALLATTTSEECVVPEIYLPWRRYNNHPSNLYNIPSDAFKMATSFHPKGKWIETRVHIHKLMARNCMQILGQNLDLPVKLVICWTEDGCENGNATSKFTGGTGQALRIATANNIPIFNLKNDSTIDRLVDFIGSFQDT